MPGNVNNLNLLYDSLVIKNRLSGDWVTEKLFWSDPYLTEIDTLVRSVDGDKITLEKTIFYAMLGGQEGDHGFIGGYNVLDAVLDGRDIIYTIESQHDLRPRDAAKVTIDWERRYKLMRLHFAAEIFLVLILRKFPDIDIMKIGAHISQDKARIDFAIDQSLTPFIAELQMETQDIIDSATDIISEFSDEPMEKRYWRIDGFAKIPCCGTHIKNTSEVGSIRLKRENPGAGKERVEIFLA